MVLSRLKLLITTSIAFLLCLPAAAPQADGAIHLKNLPPGEDVLWQDPGNVESLDFVYGIGGEANQPQGPFQFIEEEVSGTPAICCVRAATLPLTSSLGARGAHFDE